MVNLKEHRLHLENQDIIRRIALVPIAYIPLFVALNKFSLHDIVFILVPSILALFIIYFTILGIIEWRNKNIKDIVRIYSEVIIAIEQLESTDMLMGLTDKEKETIYYPVIKRKLVFLKKYEHIFLNDSSDADVEKYMLYKKLLLKE
jgi:hypothetical protein